MKDVNLLSCINTLYVLHICPFVLQGCLQFNLRLWPFTRHWYETGLWKIHFPDFLKNNWSKSHLLVSEKSVLGPKKLCKTLKQKAKGIGYFSVWSPQCCESTIWLLVIDKLKEINMNSAMAENNKALLIPSPTWQTPLIHMSKDSV